MKLELVIQRKVNIRRISFDQVLPYKMCYERERVKQEGRVIEGKVFPFAIQFSDRKMCSAPSCKADYVVYYNNVRKYELRLLQF